MGERFRGSLRKGRPLLLGLCGLALLTTLVVNPVCDNPSGIDGCGDALGEPTIWDCTGDSCLYVHIFDSDWLLRYEDRQSTVRPYSWDGIDCRGDSVLCGRYTMATYVVIGGYDERVPTYTDVLIVRGEGAVRTSGQNRCDSLQNLCWDYHRVEDSTNVQCMCCD